MANITNRRRRRRWGGANATQFIYIPTRITAAVMLLLLLHLCVYTRGNVQSVSYAHILRQVDNCLDKRKYGSVWLFCGKVVTGHFLIPAAMPFLTNRDDMRCTLS